MVCEPAQLCLDARDQCAACEQPIVAPTNECEELFETRNLSHHAHDIEPVTQIEQRRTICALGVMNAIGHQMTKRRECCRDAATPRAEVVSFENLNEARPHRERVHADVAKRVDRRFLADALCFAWCVLDRLLLGPHELAQQLLEQTPALTLRCLHTAALCSAHAGCSGAFPPRGARVACQLRPTCADVTENQVASSGPTKIHNPATT